MQNTKTKEFLGKKQRFKYKEKYWILERGQNFDAII